MDHHGIRLGVNIDHVATVRQARGTTYPVPSEAARECEAGGAHGITVHLREDRRHIQEEDLYQIKEATTLPLNLEMACINEIVEIALRLHPFEACLVPERRQELTTEGGLNVAGQRPEVEPIVGVLRKEGILVSVFIEPDPKQIEAAAQVGVPVIELHTGTYCDAPAERSESELQRLIQGARYAHQLGLQVNAGHGINLDTMNGILRIPYLHTLNIGHSIVARALTIGMKAAVMEILAASRSYTGGEK